MAGGRQGPVRDESPKVSMDRYGPQYEQVQMLVEMCDGLSPDRMHKMVEAYMERGTDDARYAWRAAEKAGRVTEVGHASWDVQVAAKLAGFNVEPSELVMVGFCATDAGIATSTRDLIGTAGYTQGDYERLMGPWMAAFGG